MKKKIIRLRTIIAYLIAPAVGAIAVVCMSEIENITLETIFISWSVYIVVYPGSALYSWLFGTPTYLLLRKLNKESFSAYLFCGIFSGIILTLLLILGVENTDINETGFRLIISFIFKNPFVIASSAVAVTFYLIKGKDTV